MFGIVLLVVVAGGIAWPVLRDKGLLTRFGIAPKPVAVEDRGGANSSLYGREELCTHCGHVNAAGKMNCTECGGAMPVEKLSDLWQGKEKEHIMREGVQCGILFLVMLVAMALSYNLPTFGKIAVLVLTMGGLSWRFLRVVQEN